MTQFFLCFSFLLGGWVLEAAVERNHEEKGRWNYKTRFKSAPIKFYSPSFSLSWRQRTVIGRASRCDWWCNFSFFVLPHRPCRACLQTVRAAEKRTDRIFPRIVRIDARVRYRNFTARRNSTLRERAIKVLSRPQSSICEVRVSAELTFCGLTADCRHVVKIIEDEHEILFFRSYYKS